MSHSQHGQVIPRIFRLVSLMSRGKYSSRLNDEARGQVAGQRALRAGPMIDGEHWQNHVLFDAAGVAVLRACPRDR